MVEQANHERRLALDKCRCTGVVTCNVRCASHTSLFFPGHDLSQPRALYPGVPPRFFVQETTDWQMSWDFGEETRSLGRDFSRISFVVLPVVSLPKELLQKIRVKIRTQKILTPKNQHNKKSAHRNPHKKSAHKITHQQQKPARRRNAESCLTLRSAETGPLKRREILDKFWGHLQRKIASDQRKRSALVRCCNSPYDTPPS